MAPIITAASLLLGVILSWSLTALGVRLLARQIDDKEKIRATAATQLDCLLKKASSGVLVDHEKDLLGSAIMSYMMTATSQRNALRYLQLLKSVGNAADDALVKETESVLKERFPKVKT